MKAENKTPACIIKKGLPDASLVADIMQRKYQLGEPLHRQEQYWKLRGIYLNRTSLANWVIAGAAWFEPVIRRLVIKKIICNVGLEVVGAYDWSPLTPVN